MDENISATDDETAEGALLFGRVLDGRGGGRPIGWQEAQGWQPQAPGEVLWLHLCRTEPGVREWLDSELGIPEPTAELLTGNANRPRAFREEQVLVATHPLDLPEIESWLARMTPADDHRHTKLAELKSQLGL